MKSFFTYLQITKLEDWSKNENNHRSKSFIHIIRGSTLFFFISIEFNFNLHIKISQIHSIKKIHQPILGKYPFQIQETISWLNQVLTSESKVMFR